MIASCPRQRVTVVGAGAAASALAARIARCGHAVTVSSRPGERLTAIRASGAVRLQEPSGVERVVPVDVVTDDLAGAVNGADVVVTAISSDKQAEVLSRVGYLLGGRIVVLVPGHTGGAWAVATALTRAGCAVPHLVEVPLPFVCRSPEPAVTHVLQEKASVAIASLPAAGAAAAKAQLERLGIPVSCTLTPLEAGLRNMTTVFQPALMLCNAARIDAASAFRIYRDGATPAVGRLFSALDAERLRVGAAYGLSLPTAAAWLGDAYGAKGATLDETIRAVPGYAQVQAPVSLQHRFLREHMATGLVPLRALAEVFEVPVPIVDAVIDLAGVLLGEDLRATGRTVARIAPDGLDRQALQRWFTGEAQL